MLRHACGPNFLENVSWVDRSLEGILVLGESLSLLDTNFQVRDQPRTSKISPHYANTYEYVAMLERHFTVQERLTPTFPTNDTI